MKKHLLLIIILSYSLSLYPQQYWFAEDYLAITVLLEKESDNKLIPHGTGFLLYNYDNPEAYILVTCGHVLKNNHIFVNIPTDTAFQRYYNQNKDRVNLEGGDNYTIEQKAIKLKVLLFKDSTYAVHEKLDIGIFLISIPKYLYRTSGTNFHIPVTNKTALGWAAILTKKHIKVGQDVYFIGFPFLIGTEIGYGLSYKKRFYPSLKFNDIVANPVIRSGSVAWMSKNNSEFLIDAFSYGGNSGSPVFTKNRSFMRNDYHVNTYSKLIGMVTGHLSDEVNDTVDKVETSGNSGLATCIWIDDILDLIKANKGLIINE